MSMRTEPTAPRSSKPHITPAPPPAPSVAASPPLRPLRPLAPSQVGLAEHLTRHHVCTLPAGTPPEHLTDPSFWGLIAERLRPCDRVDVHDAGGNFYIELYVRSATPGRPVAGTKGTVVVSILRRVDFDPVEAPSRQAAYESRFSGPAQGWCVIRISDQKIIAENLVSRDAAEARISAMATAAS
jgi:hypothetical protein